MTLRSDSYSTVNEVLAFTRHLLGGQSTFNSTTQPTVTEVEKFIDRASGVLNIALEQAGFHTPVANSTGKLALDDWVSQRAAEYVELTQRGVGFSDAEGSRTASFRNLAKSAAEFVGMYALGFKNLGLAMDFQSADGLSFTGQTAQADRADPSDTSLQQPAFVRGQFNNPESEN